MPHVLDLLFGKINVVREGEAADGLGPERRKLVVLDGGLDPPARVSFDVRPVAELEPSGMDGLSRLVAFGFYIRFLLRRRRVRPRVGRQGMIMSRH